HGDSHDPPPGCGAGQPGAVAAGIPALAPGTAAARRAAGAGASATGVPGYQQRAAASAARGGGGAQRGRGISAAGDGPDSLPSANAACAIPRTVAPAADGNRLNLENKKGVYMATLIQSRGASA